MENDLTIAHGDVDDTLTIRGGYDTYPVITTKNLSIPSTSGNYLYLGSSSSSTYYRLTFNVEGDVDIHENALITYRATINLIGDGTQNISYTTGTFNNDTWTVNKSSGEAVLQTGLTLSGATGLNVSQGTLDLNGNSLTATGGFTIQSAGNLKLQGDETYTTPTFTGDVNMVYGGTEASYTIGNYSYDNLTLEGAEDTVFSMPASMTGLGTITITSGVLSTEGYDLTASVLENEGTLRITGNEDVTFTSMDADSGTIEYVGDGDYTGLGGLAAGDQYHDLVFNSPSGTGHWEMSTTVEGDWVITSGTVDMTGDVDVTGSVSIGSAGILTTNDNNLTLGGNWNNSGVFNAGAGTVIFNATTGTYTIDPGTSAFNDLEFHSAATYDLAGDLDVNGDFRLTPFIEGYSHYKVITIPAYSVSETLSDFPVLVRISNDSDLQANVQNSDGYDIIFTDANGAVLDREIESYDNASGTLAAWVKTNIPQDEDTAVFMHYGKAGVLSDPQDPSAVWSNGYLGVWHLTDLSDSVGSNDGVEYVTPDTDLDVSGLAGGGVFFDGDFILLSKYNELEGASDYTMSAWVNTTSSAPSMGVVGQFDTGGHITAIHIASGTTPAFITYEGGYSNVVDSSGPPLNDGEWRNITITKEGTTGRIYMDGLEGNTSGTVHNVTSTTQMRIGTRESNVYPFIGFIDEVRVSSINRQDAWIAAEYASQSETGTFCEVAGTVTFNTNDYDMNVSGNWVNAGGGFNAGTAGEVVFDGTAQSDIRGATTFNNLTISTAQDGAKTVRFEAGETQTILGTLILTGAEGKVLTIDSTQADSAAFLDIPGDIISGVNYVSVKDNQVIGGNEITATSLNSTDRGNNTPGWNFDLPALYTWIGAGATNNWSDNANWQGGSPLSAGTGIFSGVSSKDCTIDRSDVLGIDIRSGYEGVVSVSGANLTIGYGGYSLKDGTFRAPTGSLYISGGDWDHNGGIFDPNGGTVVFYGGSANITVPVSETFYSLTIQKTGNLEVSGKPLIVNGDFTMINGSIDNATIEVHKDLYVGPNYDGVGSSTIKMVGDEALQTIHGTVTTLREYLEINKSSDDKIVDFAGDVTSFATAYDLTITSGTLKAPATTLTISNGDWIHNGGIFDPNGGTVVFYGAGSSINVPASETFYSLTVQKNGTALDATGKTITVNGDFTMYNGLIAGATVEVHKDVYVGANYDGVGSSVVKMVGDEALQTIRGTGTTAPVFREYLEINKSSDDNIVDFAGDITNFTAQHDLTITSGTLKAPATTLTISNGDWIHNSGIFDPNGGTVVFYGGNANITVPVSETFYNLTIQKTGNLEISDKTITVNGDFTMYNGLIAGATVEVHKDVYVGANYDGVGSSVVKMVGDEALQTIRGTGTTAPVFREYLEIDKSSDEWIVDFEGDVTALTAQYGLTIKSGILDLDDKNLTVSGSFLVQDGGSLEFHGTAAQSVTIPTFQAGSTVIYSGDSSYSGLKFGNSYPNSSLIFRGGGGRIPRAVILRWARTLS
ncbi:LamG-like jellyroll fold domain-containing protein [Candidatus Omnitrophota bacterium]